MNPDAMSIRDYLLVPVTDVANLPIFLRKSHEKRTLYVCVIKRWHRPALPGPEG
jgi:hypothetical protein